MFECYQGSESALLLHVKTAEAYFEAGVVEFRELSRSAGASIVSEVIAPLKVIHPKYYVGKGKALEVAETIAASECDLVLVNQSLSPVQERNLERLFKCRVLDRSGLILDIFAQRAQTFEGKLQVELAQLTHLSTRLVRGWTHLERQKGGIGLRGPGEKQLEIDRRLLNQRIATIKKRLDKVRKQSFQRRQARKQALLPIVALVGYTNAGKSTLFNKLTKSAVLAENKLFATLDPTFRLWNLPKLGQVILVDTVGFVQDLPHELIEAFHATLQETREADLLLHVIDDHDEVKHTHRKQVEKVLEEIGALDVKRLAVYNKIDISRKKPQICQNNEGELIRVELSALEEEGLDLLAEAIVSLLDDTMVEGWLSLNVTEARIHAKLHALKAVVEEAGLESGGWKIAIKLPKLIWFRLCEEEKDLKDKLVK